MNGDVDGNGDGTIDETDRTNWQDALQYCEDLVFAGHDDWRLPNVRELQSIVDYGRWDPATDPLFGTVPTWYWTSSSHKDTPTFVWLVDLGMGVVGFGGKRGSDHIRAVRGGLDSR